MSQHGFLGQLLFDKQNTGNVAVKLSTGEAGNNYYLSPDLIKNLVQSVDGTIVECNTAYSGSRASTAMHLQVAEDHGFTAITALMASGILDSSLQFHIQNAKNHGVTETEMVEILTHTAFYAGWPKAWATTLRTKNHFPPCRRFSTSANISA